MAKRKRLESSIEEACLKYAKVRWPKMLIRKMNGMGSRSWPDRMFLFQGRVLFIEFKREGEEPTPLQKKMHEELAAQGFDVRVVDNVELGKVAISGWATEPPQADRAKWVNYSQH